MFVNLSMYEQIHGTKFNWETIHGLKLSRKVRALLNTLRDRQTDKADFNKAAWALSALMAKFCRRFLGMEQYSFQGVLEEVLEERPADPVLIPVLQAGDDMRWPFENEFPRSRTYYRWPKRDEKTLEVKWVAPPSDDYKPSLEDVIFILDPMLATGNTACLAIQHFINDGASEHNIYYCSLFAAPEGVAHVQEEFPLANLVLVAVDRELDENGFIRPGVGDFGDRSRLPIGYLPQSAAPAITAEITESPAGINLPDNSADTPVDVTDQAEDTQPH